MYYCYLAHFAAKSGLRQLKKCGHGVTRLLPLYGKGSNCECRFYVHLYLVLEDHMVVSQGKTGILSSDAVLFRGGVLWKKPQNLALLLTLPR